MRVLLTGAGGFIGRHLCAGLHARGIETVAMGRQFSAARHYAGRFIAIDGLPDRSDLEAILDRVQPDAIYHLAGSSSESSLRCLYDANLFYAVRMLEASRALAKIPKIVLAGSAAEYGQPFEAGRPIKESDPALPLSAYGETKLAQSIHAMRQFELPIIVARIFNPIGEGLSHSRAAGHFVGKVQAIKSKGGGTIETGPLDGIRDVADIADVSAAMIDLTVKDIPTGEIYNLCTGVGTRMSQITDSLETLVPYNITFLPSTADGGVDWVVGDNAKLAAHKVKIKAPDLQTILARMLTFRSELSEGQRK